MPSKDFKSNQIRTTKLIASGAISGGGPQPNNNIGIAVYSASIASDIAGGITDTKFLDKVGPDVMMVISGNIGGTDASTGFGPSGTEPGGITLFTGDVFTSGSLGMGKISSAPGTIGDNSLALYAKDDAGSTKLFYKHGTTEVGPLGSGGAASLNLYAENGSPGVSPSVTAVIGTALGDGALVAGSYGAVGGGKNNKIN
ncbi:MAG: hypothetical protein HN793_15260, partial [Rhodospirillaceae bacterium]|nr:hypothetical protein [Rhodospirillaceae bacterium]